MSAVRRVHAGGLSWGGLACGSMDPVQRDLDRA